MPKQTASNNFMWSAPNPCNGQTGPEGLYGKIIRDFMFFKKNQLKKSAVAYTEIKDLI